jgi:GT2 family glycosyltransferase
VAQHERSPEASAVVGQVLQPGEAPKAITHCGRRDGLWADLEFPFYSSQSDWIRNVMAGNLSVNRECALRIGGFDENFLGVAYRFETEFARRMIANGGRIRYCAEASIDHLRVSRGGTRSGGSHLTSADPRHGVGDYYFAMCARANWFQRWVYMLRRPLREVTTRFHLKHPWYVPVKLVGELRAFWAAVSLCRRGPRLLNNDEDSVAVEERCVSLPNELSQRG